jgi:hypothetical protein
VRRAGALSTLVLLLVVAGLMTGTAWATGSFADDDSSAHESDIEWIAVSGITRGCNPPDNDHYCPDEPVTRGQMAAFMNRAFSLDPSSRIFFNDTVGHVFEADIAAMASAGVTRGCNPPDNDLFCPDAFVTRGQMASFLRRAIEETGPPASTPTTATTTSTSIAPTTSSSSTSTSTTTTTTTTTPSSTTSSTLPHSSGPPVLAAIGSQWIVAGRSVDLEISATHPDGHHVDFDGVLPAFADIDDNGDGTASLSLTPGPGHVGTYELTVIVSDSNGLEDSEVVTLTVQPDTTGNEGPWIETNGLLLIDVESNPPVDNWILATPPGHLGSGVFQWTVADQHQGAPTLGIVSYQFEITEAGTYRVSARSRRDGTGSPDQHNDMFVKLDSGPWAKFFQLGGTHKTWEWNHRRETLVNGEHIREAWIVDLEAGSHVLSIAGRSVQFQVDRLAMHLEHDVFPQDHFPESPRADTP